jgi:hypothetical protein
MDREADVVTALNWTPGLCSSQNQIIITARPHEQEDDDSPRKFSDRKIRRHEIVSSALETTHSSLH